VSANLSPRRRAGWCTSTLVVASAIVGAFAYFSNQYPGQAIAVILARPVVTYAQPPAHVGTGVSAEIRSFTRCGRSTALALEDRRGVRKPIIGSLRL
jgi:hypothetical protein